ncbi:MAG: hypothetical protein AB1427_16585 [Thermodesulfobacteriota bacterium]
MLRRFLVLVVIAGLIAGCAMSSRKINNVRLGMTKTEVIQAMGEPNYTAAKDDMEILSYKLSDGSLLMDEYIVRIKSGKVDLFGQRYDFGSLY